MQFGESLLNRSVKKCNLTDLGLGWSQMRKWQGYNNHELLCPISENGLVLKGSMTDLDA
jgi:hypothetical protein